MPSGRVVVARSLRYVIMVGTMSRSVPQGHLSLDLLRRAANDGRASVSRLLARLLEHCGDGCGEAWEAFEAERGSVVAKLARAVDSAALVEAILETDLVAEPRSPGRRDDDEAHRAQRELRLLLRRPPHDRLVAVRRARSRYRSAALVDALLEQAREVVRTDSAAALELVDLAEEVVARLPAPASAGETALRPSGAHPLAVRCIAERANAFRVMGRLRSAELLFHRLHGMGAGGSDVLLPLFPEAPGLSAELAKLEASLRLDQLHLKEAGGLARLGVLLSRYVGDSVGEAKALILLGDAERLEGRNSTANSCLQIARRRLPSRKRFGLIRLCSAATEARCLCELGQEATARRLLARHEHLLSLGEDSWVQPRLLSLQGRIAQGLGNVNEAEQKFEAARALFEEKGSPLDASRVTIDLALMWLEGGRTQKALEATRTIQRTFESRGAVLDGEPLRELFVRTAEVR
jgi:tetratricopeptide (TPR) repeat protein